MSEPGLGIRGPWGREALLERIGTAVTQDRLPQSLLLRGPAGTQKRELALWVGALLQCAEPGPRGPCRRCRSCRLAERLEHPDIHLHFPMPRPKRASSREKLREAIESQRLARLAELREDPDGTLDEEAVTGIYLAAIENVRSQAARRPAMGRRVVFIIEEADRMVPQSSSPEAANAFLKLLEEPPDYAYLLLTSSRPEALLPTIRSRTASLRLPPLPEDRVLEYLADSLDAEGERALAVARRAEGAVGRARRLWSSDDEAARETADRLLRAALTGSPRARHLAASRFSARGARATLLPALEELRTRLRDLLCLAAGAGDRALDSGAIRTMLGDRHIEPERVLDAFGAVDEALDGTSRNLNPQSTVAVLLRKLGRALARADRAA